MSNGLSQEEIDALLSAASNTDSSDGSNNSIDYDDGLTSQEIDAIGEIGNISMGTSATTLFTLLGQKVVITTPKVSILNWEQISEEFKTPVVVTKVEYTSGLSGGNVLLLYERDVMIITDLMMGGDGTNISGELTELHLSAISEAMNQMVGSSATSLSSMFNKKIDISPPKVYSITDKSNELDPSLVMTNDMISDSIFENIDTEHPLVKISFKMTVGELIDSEIMQIMPVSFAKDLVFKMFNPDVEETKEPKVVKEEIKEEIKEDTPDTNIVQRTDENEETNSFASNTQAAQKNEQLSQFGNYIEDSSEKKNIDMIIDVPLEVSVELGSTSKLVKDILKLGPGSVVELDKLESEPIDVLINGKVIAKGEIVGVDDKFGVRITDIIHPLKRIQ